MGSSQFLRKWKISAGKKTDLFEPPPAFAPPGPFGEAKVLSWESDNGEGLRVVFNIERDDSNVPNNCELEIFNLSQSSRDFFLEANEDDPLFIKVEAGYEPDNMGQIFAGLMRYPEVSIEGTEIITRLSGGDGEKEFLTATVPKIATWPLGTPAPIILDALIGYTLIEKGNVEAAALKILTEISVGSYAARGDAFDALQRFCNQYGLKPSVQDGKWDIAANSASPSVLQQPIKVAASTGMIDRPHWETVQDKKTKKKIKQVKVATRLNPGMRPGVPFLVDSDLINDVFVCTSSKHFGDTDGSDWTTELVGKVMEIEPVLKAIYSVVL